MYRIAIFGGTFDPVHQGHIQVSLAIQTQFNFDEYRFIPCRAPVLKKACVATNEQRIDMLHLALDGLDEFQIDLREINRPGKSYMVDTLESLHLEHTTAALTLILGWDAFSSLPQWHEWRKIIQLANVLVVDRQAANPSVLDSRLQELVDASKEVNLLDTRAGTVNHYHAGSYSISSSEIRKLIKQDHVRDMLPDKVFQYIRDNGIYD